jgi:hypothetical protein
MMQNVIVLLQTAFKFLCVPAAVAIAVESRVIAVRWRSDLTLCQVCKCTLYCTERQPFRCHLLFSYLCHLKVIFFWVYHCMLEQVNWRSEKKQWRVFYQLLVYCSLVKSLKHAAYSLVSSCIHQIVLEFVSLQIHKAVQSYIEKPMTMLLLVNFLMFVVGCVIFFTFIRNITMGGLCTRSITPFCAGFCPLSAETS